MREYYQMEKEELLEALETEGRGLSAQEAVRRLERFGQNRLQEEKQKSVLQIFLSQFADLLVVILMAAAVISLLSGNHESTLVIFAVIILNAILGTVQHLKARQSLKSLQALSAPVARVLRDGTLQEIPSREVVPGDLLVLEAGDLVNADGRVLESFSLQVNESSLTGESESVHKHHEAIGHEDVALGDRRNMVFSGSMVTYGRGNVLVTGTGMNTELGKIARLMNETREKKTPLQVSLDRFSKTLSFLILLICLLVFGLSLWRSMPVLDSLMFAVALAVAAIPEALSSIVTIVLAVGTRKMADENAIMKNLKSVEGLGCVSVICSDKTGTLTMNRMTVQKVYADGEILDAGQVDPGNHTQGFLLRTSVLCNDATASLGDPTEIALVDFSRSRNLDENEIRDRLDRIGEIPFDSDRKLMSTLHEIDGRFYLLTKGAIDVVMERVDSVHYSDGVKKITEEDRDHIGEAVLSMSREGLRVLGFVYREIESVRQLSTEDETGYTFIGLIAMMDPPRPESARAVADCRRAGIRPVMITGDHRVTAVSIARMIGIWEEGDRALEGPELEAMSREELEDIIGQVSVYARVSPEHKIRIVEAWQNRGNVVAMTGDGVNDAPALKKADIGIAMGITGTAVSRDAASMILTDDNFATIVKAVVNGRNIFANIRNSIRFLLSGNTSGILVVLWTSLAGLPVPFLPVHLLFINLLTDSLPAIAIGMEKPGKDLLEQKPRDPREEILNRESRQSVLLQGILLAVPTAVAFLAGLGTSPAAARTMAFATLAMARLYHGFNCRGRRSLADLGLTSNPFSLYAFGAGTALLTLVLTVPGLHRLFGVVPLSPGQLAMIFLGALLPTLLIQGRRMLRERRKKRG